MVFIFHGDVADLPAAGFHPANLVCLQRKRHTFSRADFVARKTYQDRGGVHLVHIEESREEVHSGDSAAGCWWHGTIELRCSRD